RRHECAARARAAAPAAAAGPPLARGPRGDSSLLTESDEQVPARPDDTCPAIRGARQRRSRHGCAASTVRADGCSSARGARHSSGRRRSATRRAEWGGPLMPRALVTGGAGFIGSHVVEALTADGFDVEVLDDLSSGRRENLAAGVPLHETSITTPDAARLVREGGFDVVAHLAAQIDVRKSVADPAYDATVNVV